MAPKLPDNPRGTSLKTENMWGDLNSVVKDMEHEARKLRVEILIDLCRKTSGNYKKCPHCEFRFKCWTRR